MGAGMVMHLERLGLYEGEPMYSIKRGAMQHELSFKAKACRPLVKQLA